MSNKFKIRTTSASIVIETKTCEHIAEYASREPKQDAAKMRRTIKAHLSQLGATLNNYAW